MADDLFGARIPEKSDRPESKVNTGISYTSGAKGVRIAKAHSGKRGGMPFPMAIFFVVCFLFAGADMWLSNSHYPILSNVIFYGCHTQAYQMGYVWVHTENLGNQLVPNYDYQNICGWNVKNSFYYLLGAEVISVYVSFYLLVPFLIQYVKDKSVENSFDKMKLLPLYKQWIFLACVIGISFFWILFFVEYFLSS